MRDDGRNAGSGNGGERLYSVRMWGYLPAASVQRVPLLLPTPVPLTALDDPLKIVCNGGCGFAIAISESGKLNTWGSTTDLGQCYLISGKQQESPEPFTLQTDSPIIQAAAGWAHCAAVAAPRRPAGNSTMASRRKSRMGMVGAAVADGFMHSWRLYMLEVSSAWGEICLVLAFSEKGNGEVFTWGWSECVPNPKSNADEIEQVQGDETSVGAPNTSLQLSPRNNVGAVGKATSSAPPLRVSGGLIANIKQTGRGGNRNLTCKTTESKGVEEIHKKRKVVSFEDGGSPESPTAAAAEENVFAPPCLVTLDPGIRITSVAAGGRHTLALSDGGRVWGWGYGGEGQLGLGSRMRIVSSPQYIPCLNPPDNGMIRTGAMSSGLNGIIPGSYIRAIACGGRHSAVITDAGALLTFGWGLYGQVGQGSTEDELSPSRVATMGGLHVVGIAAGLWHTLCITDVGDVYAFGGNQFGQLGVGGNHAEMSPRLIDAPLLEDETTVAVACGARHSVVLTGTGKIFSWGWNKYGQLGLGDNNNRDLPMQVTMNDGGRAASIACGWWHTLASVQVN